MRSRLMVVLAAFVVLATSYAPAHGQTTVPSPQTDWRPEVRRLLEQRARAVESGDLAAFIATMRLASPAFMAERRTWFDRLRALPLGSYRLVLDEGEFGDLARPLDVAKYGGEVHVVQVKERIGFKGFDRAPSNEDLYLTLRRDVDGWSVVSDTDVEDIALLSMRNMWDYGPVEHIARDGVLVVFHPARRAAAETALAESRQARDVVRRAWPSPWRDPIVVMIPDTVDELARVLQTQFDLSAFVAFAASSLDRDRGWSLGGDRVYLHTPNYTRYGADFRSLILRHEFVHLATRATTGPYVPAFMDEGVAMVYGEDGAPTPTLRARVRAGTFDGHVPEDWLFVSNRGGEIDLAYEASTSFVESLRRRYGDDAGARAYLALGKESADDAGTWRYHLDRAFRAAFRTGFVEIERAWAEQVRRELR